MAEVAAEGGITPQTVRAIESGKNPPKIDTLFRICRALDVRIAILATHSGKVVRITT